MHFLVIVAGPDIQAQLAPYEGKKWDCYQTGGRYSGALKLKPGAAGELGDTSPLPFELHLKELLEGIGETVVGLRADEAVVKPGYADIARRGDIDLSDFDGAFAVVKDGQWEESWPWQHYRFFRAIEEMTARPLRGDMGELGDWHALKRAHGEWSAHVRAKLEALPKDMIVTIVDCHN